MDYPIEAEGLKKSFRQLAHGQGLTEKINDYLGIGKARHVVFDSFDLKVKQGEIYGLLGPNGSGKTTLIRILATTMLPDSGTVTVNGLDVSDSRNKDRISSTIGVVLGERSRSFYWRLTAKQNLEFYAAMYDVDRKEATERAEYILDFVGLGKRKDDSLFNFSSGMLNRLAIARAFLHSPDILLLDEFLVNLDPKASYDTREVIRNLARKERKTVFFTSNNAYEAESMADRVGILYKGRMVAEGTVEELKQRFGEKDTTVRLTFDAMPVGSDALVRQLRESGGISHTSVRGTTMTLIATEPMAGLENAVRIFKSKGVRVRNVEVLPSSLESVFINITRDKTNGA
ncbi:MAG: ABC transporter ATP-binding protein [Candidatus ainarchaeum sp.]|nr:ABC transporter ATP-binding protein [Candidatus ainarchaeum sp.]